MNAILLQNEALERDREEFATVSTTFNKRDFKKFPSRPIAVVRSVRSVAQTSDKDFSAEAKSYYLSPSFSGFERIFLPSQPYEIRTIEEQSEEQLSDDIAVHELVRSIAGQRVRFVQPLSNVRHGRFLAPSNPLATGLPRSPSRDQKLEIDADFETDEEEPFWRGVFALPSSTEVIFSKKIEVKVDELPSWEPHIVIDSYRLEDDDE